MSKTRYKIKEGNTIFLKGFGKITEQNLTPKIAEKLLSTGDYDNIIEVLKSKKKDNENESESENGILTDNN